MLKKRTILLSLFVVMISHSLLFSQINTVVINVSKDVQVWSYDPTGLIDRGTTRQDIAIYEWTKNGAPTTKYGILDFEFSNIPENAVIVDAKLSLYHDPISIDIGHSQLSGSNEALIKRVTSDWNETIGWNLTPSFTDANAVLLPASTSDTQNYLDIDVTNLTQDIVNDMSNSYGFLIHLVSEQHYRSLVFASSEHPDSDLHPTLEVTYELACDSAIYFSTEGTICSGESYTYADGTLHANIVADETYTSTLTGQASNGCDSVVTENIYVINTPEAPVFLNPNTSLCLGETEIYTLMASENINTYHWQLPQGWSGSSITNEIQLTCNQNSGYLVVTGENECGISESNSVYINVVDEVASQPSIISGPNPVCVNSNASYSVIDVPNTIYYWDLPDTWSGTGNNSSINVTTGLDGGTITLVPFNACGMGISRTLKVNVSDILPIADFTYTENQSEITFNNLSQDAESYYWHFDDGENSSIVNPVHDYLNSGQYIARLTVYNSCGEDYKEELIDLLDLSLGDIESDAISVYPNPSSGIFNIESSSAYNFDKISIANNLGQVIYTTQEFDNHTTIDISDLPKGLYFIQVYEKENIIGVKKVIKK